MPRSNAAVAREFRKVQASFRQLARSFTRITPLLIAAPVVSTTKESGDDRRTRRTLSPARLRALKLQGRYLGTLRGLKPRQRSRVKAIRAAKGVRAALAYARRITS